MSQSVPKGSTALSFIFSTQQLRAIMIDGEPWFVAADLLETLTLERKALERLDDDEKGVNTIHTPGGDQEMTIINESGLYSLILGSRKPEAKKFKKWVTSEVLPAIRKTGRYIDNPSPPSPPPPEKLGNLGTWVVQQVHHHTDRYLSRTGHGNAASVRSVVKAHFGTRPGDIPATRLTELLDLLEDFAADCYSLHYACKHLEQQLVASWSKQPSALPPAVGQLMAQHPASRTPETAIQQIRARAQLKGLGLLG
jgi:hypothetical protein